MVGSIIFKLMMLKYITGINEYSGAFYTACPVAGNRHSILMETNVPEAETA